MEHYISQSNIIKPLCNETKWVNINIFSKMYFHQKTPVLSSMHDILQRRILFIISTVFRRKW